MAFTISVKSWTWLITPNHRFRRGKTVIGLADPKLPTCSKSWPYPFNHKPIVFQLGLPKRNVTSAIHDLNPGIWDQFKYGTHKKKNVTRHFCIVINKAVANYYSLVAFLRYAIKSALSAVFLMPAKIIFVPGMYFLGFSKYSIKVSSPQVIPLFLLASV